MAEDVKVDEATFSDPLFREYISENVNVGGTGESGVEAGDRKLIEGEIARIQTVDLSKYNSSEPAEKLSQLSPA